MTMFVAFKINKKAVLAALAAIAVIVLAVLLSARGGKDGVKLKTAAAVQKTSINSENDIKEFLSSLGYDVSDRADEISEVNLPEKMNDVYGNYNELQKECGYDLSGYMGKRVKRYMYELGDGKRINVLLHKGKVIAGDISDAAIDGKMTGLISAE